MPRHRFTLLVCLLALAAGCGDQSTESEVQLPDWLSETESTASSSEALDQGTESSNAIPARDASAAGSSGPVLPLRPGAHFPLHKIVEQELQQSSLNGQPQISRSRIEFLLTLTVADVRDGHTLMQVQYDRVHYTENVAGEQIEYDSAQPPQNIPPAARAYHSMVGDGFAFWLGPDNKVVQAMGFREFVDRCMAHLPADQRQHTQPAVETSAGQQAVADFVDSTIGLLPGEGEQLTSGRWEESQHVAEPVPMQINTTYTLTSMSEQTAEVTIGGTIIPSTTLGANAMHDAPVKIRVNGGSTSGQCTIDRRSGLPRHSQLEQIVDMTVQMDGGIEFAQRKRTLTTVEALPQQRLAAHEERPQFR